jgi:putative peptide zinc metalloprotease protein
MTSAPMTASDVLAVRALTVVAEGDEFLVGDPESSVYVLLPAVGVRLIELLRTGRTLGEVSSEAEREIGRDVDVVDFAQSLLELGFATVADAGGVEADQRVTRPSRPPSRWLRRSFSRLAWIVYAACAVAGIGLLAVRPALFPRASDLFFLDTPARSLAALTVIIYALAAAHEGCHWLAARAEGIDTRITVSRRLYFLVLEIDLTGLWSLPRRRRYGALLAGMAFDAVLLFALLLARFGDGAGWWRLGDSAGRILAALTFVQIAALISQFWIFVRTDAYAVLITATGCVNLFRVNQLMVRRALRISTAEQERELRESHARDRAVARWYRWIYLAGLGTAAWFFVAYFAPATIRLAVWIVSSIAHAGVGSEHFWEAVVLGGLIFSPRMITLTVALRDLRRWSERRRQQSSAATVPSH